MANVIGTAAFDYFLESAEHTAMDLRIQLSSCVPATHLETAGARIEAPDLRTTGGTARSSALPSS